MSFRRFCIPFLLLPVFACSGRDTNAFTPSAPSSAAASPRATFTLNGQVISSRTREPISGATVSIRNDPGGSPDTARSTTTDVLGNFSFMEVQQSEVYAWVSAEEYISRSAILTRDMNRVSLVPLGQAIQQFGRVTDISTSAPIAGATVSINGWYRTTTDASGNYSLTGHLSNGNTTYTFVNADGYEQHTRYIRGNPAQSFRLRRIERILPGESWPVTIQPDDPLCFSDYHEPGYARPGSGSLCRTVRLTAQRDGMLQVEAVSTVDGSHPPLVVEVFDMNCCGQEMRNPMSVRVGAGVEVRVHVEMPESSTTSQSFIVTTSMSR